MDVGLTRWCESQPDLVPFTGQWAVHRGQLLRLEGALDEALEELQRACERYDLVGEPYAAGLAMYERGEVLRERGAYAGRGGVPGGAGDTTRTPAWRCCGWRRAASSRPWPPSTGSRRRRRR